MTRTEIYALVNKYIGVDGGYLVDFTYRTHQEFYPYYCDLDIDPLTLSGMTTRERFIHILETASPLDQAKIVRGVLTKCPPMEGADRRAPRQAVELEQIAARLEGAPAVRSGKPRITSEVVDRAIDDAEALIATNGATSGVDRVHTALHGYARALCDDQRITYGDDPNLTDLFKLLREQHPKFKRTGPRAEDVQQVLRALGAIIGALSPLRNRASVAHPNPALLEEPEAMLVINAARTILHYLDSKLAA